MKRIISGCLFFIFLSIPALARENLRELFKNNSAIVYTINIRNFASFDKNLDGLINPLDGDKNGTFLSAVQKLPQLKKEGINTIYLLPITPVGKLKALGNAGSLYSLDSFNTLNPQLDDDTNDISVFDEAKEFFKKAHELDLNVIVDLPSCGSYDLSLRKPNWFLTNEKGENITPADWTDVRLFKIYNDDGTLYEETLNNFKSFIDMVIELGADGIRADVAAIKPYKFWFEIIKYARLKNRNFAFLAEANPDWSNPAQNAVSNYTTVDELLKAGFDCYYGSWNDFQNLKTNDEFYSKIEKNLKIIKNNKNSSMIGAIATHDQKAPVLRSINYWNTVLWLNVTMPMNTYILDGFPIGDNFIYEYENKPVNYTLTDDEYYFVHSGQFDIFNLSAPPKGKYPKLYIKYLRAIEFKNNNINLIKNAKFSLLKTSNNKVYAYSIKNLHKEIIAIGSLDEEQNQEVVIKNSSLKKGNYLFSIVNSKSKPNISNGNIKTTLEPLELQVFLIDTLKNKQ